MCSVDYVIVVVGYEGVGKMMIIVEVLRGWGMFNFLSIYFLDGYFSEFIWVVVDKIYCSLYLFSIFLLFIDCGWG